MVGDTEVYLEGTFGDSTIRITAEILINPDDIECGIFYFCLYEKVINTWQYQEILAEDVNAKYQGMFIKAEKKLPALVEKYKVKYDLEYGD